MIDVNKIEHLDILHTADTRRLWPTSVAIRGASAGWRRMFDTAVPVHTVIARALNGRVCAASMTGRKVRCIDGQKRRGCVVEPLSAYGGRRPIVGVSRMELCDSDIARVTVEVERDISRRAKYDRRVWADWVPLVRDMQDRDYCSEWVITCTRDVMHWPLRFYARVSPLDLMRYEGAHYRRVM